MNLRIDQKEGTYMISRRDAYRGCLLGLAIGDAMGYPADTKTWPQIQEEYGPYGLMILWKD